VALPTLRPEREEGMDTEIPKKKAKSPNIPVGKMPQPKAPAPKGISPPKFKPGDRIIINQFFKFKVISVKANRMVLRPEGFSLE